MFPDLLNLVSCRVIQLGLEKSFTLFFRLSNFDFNPFEFDPINDKLIGAFLSLFRFPLPRFVLVFFNFCSFCPCSPSARGWVGSEMGWTKGAWARISEEVVTCLIKNSCSVSGGKTCTLIADNRHRIYRAVRVDVQTYNCHNCIFQNCSNNDRILLVLDQNYHIHYN